MKPKPARVPSLLYALRIGYNQLVLFGQASVRPDGHVVAAAEIA
jgi:hypothetical protein